MNGWTPLSESSPLGTTPGIPVAVITAEDANQRTKEPHSASWIVESFDLDPLVRSVDVNPEKRPWSALRVTNANSPDLLVDNVRDSLDANA